MDITLKINNQLTSSGIIRITDGIPTIHWDFTGLTVLDVDEYTGQIDSTTIVPQKMYELRIGTSHSSDLGNGDFYGDILQTGEIYTTDKFHRYAGRSLVRGTSYYGQIRVVDNLNRSSGWKTFRFRYNTLPVCLNASISPSNPTVNNDLVLNYTYYDADGDTETGTHIRWYRDGIHDEQYNNLTTIKSRYLQNGDIWYASIWPSDGYEYGPRSSTIQVTVKTSAPVVSTARILPTSPTENDILKVDCDFTGNLILSDSEIRWFINGEIDRDFNNKSEVRLDVQAGDTVKYEIKPNYSESYVSSNTVTISQGNFYVYDLRVDGRIKPLDVSTLTPTLSWRTYKPDNRDFSYVSIKVGKYYGDGSVYNTVIQSDEEKFTLPGNLLNRGQNYYISVSVNDTNSFDNYRVSYFRVNGIRWQDSVSNSTGWTIETSCVIDSTSQGAFDESKYQVIRAQDGTKFCEVRLYNQKLSFVSSSITYSDTLDTTGRNVILICGKGSNAKVFHNGVLVIDATGKLTQSSTSKLLEIGVGTQSTIIVNYHEINYTVTGSYDPTSSSSMSNIQFYNYVYFPYSEAKGFSIVTENGINKKVFGINPDDSDDSGAIWSIENGDAIDAEAVSRTFSPINKINVSKDDVYTVFAHSRGSAIFQGYYLSSTDYNNNLDFVSSQVYPDNSGWELIQNIGKSSVYFTTDGLNIDTSYSQTGDKQ